MEYGLAVANEKLRKRIALLEAVIENFPGGLLLFDSNLELVLCNVRQKELLDYPDSLFENGNPTMQEIFRFNAERGEYGPGDPETLVAMRMDLVKKRCAHVFQRTRPNGTILEIRGQPLTEGGFVTTYLDATAQRAGNQVLEFYARHDLLTGLPNRSKLEEHLNLALTSMESGKKFAVHFIDLDRFKAVNDEHGHTVGDQAIKLVAQNVEGLLRSTDLICRYGGDEFVVVQNNIRTASDATVLAERVISEIARQRMVEDCPIEIGASIGIAIGPWHGRDSKSLIEAADLAAYASKKRGGNVATLAQLKYEVDEATSGFDFDTFLDFARAI